MVLASDGVEVDGRHLIPLQRPLEDVKLRVLFHCVLGATVGCELVLAPHTYTIHLSLESYPRLYGFAVGLALELPKDLSVMWVVVGVVLGMSEKSKWLFMAGSLKSA